MGNVFKLVLGLIFVIFMVTIGPWCFIWAINELVVAGGVTTFAIPFTFWTWLAALILGGLSIIPMFRRV